MRYHPAGLILALAISFSGCAFLRGVAGPAAALVCDALVDVIDPGSGAVAASLCPALAREVQALLDASGSAGRVSRRGGVCGPVQVTTIAPEAHPAAYYCATRLGGPEAVRDLHARALARMADAGAP